MFSKVILSATAVTALFAGTATAICSGYDFGITEVDSKNWNVVDGSCNVVDQVTSQKPCDVGVFDCNSAANAFTGLHHNGVHYTCKPGDNAGSCDGHDIKFCCLRDGTQQQQQQQQQQQKQPSTNQPQNPQPKKGSQRRGYKYL